MVLDVAMAGVAAAEVSGVVVLLGATRARAMRVGAADEAHLEGVGARRPFQGEPCLEGVADHVALGEAIDRDVGRLLRQDFAIDRAQHLEIVALDLLESAELIGGSHAAAGEAIEATLRSAFVLSQLDQGLEVGALLPFGRRRGVAKHQSARKIRVVRDREHVAARPGVEALLPQTLPEAGEGLGARLVARNRHRRHVLVAEDHVAVKVVTLGRLRVLVSDEAREAAGGRAVVGVFGGPLDRLPGVAARRITVRERAREGLRGLVLGHAGEARPPARGHELGPVVARASHHAMRPPVAEAPGVHRADADLAEEFGMVGHGREIEGPLNAGLDRLLAEGVGQRDLLTHRIAIGGRGVVSLARDVGVERVARVDVEVSEHRAPERIEVAAGLALLGPLEGGGAGGGRGLGGSGRRERACRRGGCLRQGDVRGEAGQQKDQPREGRSASRGLHPVNLSRGPRPRNDVSRIFSIGEYLRQISIGLLDESGNVGLPFRLHARVGVQIELALDDLPEPRIARRASLDPVVFSARPGSASSRRASPAGRSPFRPDRICPPRRTRDPRPRISAG